LSELSPPLTTTDYTDVTDDAQPESEQSVKSVVKKKVENLNYFLFIKQL